MNYIIYDLEFTVSRSTRYSSEIIDIGAVKVAPMDDEGKLGVVDSFHTYVRPSNKSVLSTDTIQFTGITQKDIDAAPLFPEAVQQFIEWLPDTYYLCSWGPDDKSKFLSHCRTHQVKVDWIRNHNDIQKQISRALRKEGGSRQLGLSQALTMCGIPFDGTQHRALDDAINTAKIFIHHFEHLKLAENSAADEEGTKSKLVYSSGDDDKHNPFGDLANLLRPSDS
ncbi:3'-5' exonuclease [Paenibacillus polygoni]|uniref:3'-5' exonuclease n=1 Tax=Paenibacillus polygoni TaxID=3050112 RepID=A0ABY8X3H1_9BACL|nr:3'-5' exonuclease [Paenibacillus polygoni]WIV20076.1 3'-5' exonuclease [Paenibacillus polygoni]